MSTYAYEQLVRAFRKARRGHRLDDDGQSGIDSVAEAIAEILADDDPKFDAEAFRQAVGV